MNVAIPGFRDFLLEAKRNTYASEFPQVASEPFLESSKQLQYSRDEFLYRDIYFGSEQFSGIEVVYVEKTPVWTMVYSGGILAPADSREVFSFLKSALRSASTDFPVRGPRIFREGDLTYENTYQGTIDKFLGQEHIMIKDSETYFLRYNGGLIH